MDPNNSNQDQSQQATPSQNDSPVDSATQDQPASDTPADTATQDQPSDSTPPAEQSATPTQEVSDQTPPAEQTDPATQNDASAAAASTYIEDVGEDLIDLLDDIEADDNLIQVVANEMRLDKERVKATLSKLLDKIDQGQVTAEELALIMAAPVVDEVQAEQTPTEQTPTEQAPVDKSSETSNTQQ